MSTARSLDLRQRTLAALHEEGLTHREVAAATILEVFHARRDMTLAELQAELAERGLQFGYGTLWRFFDRRGYTRKKRPPTRPSSSARTS